MGGGASLLDSKDDRLRADLQTRADERLRAQIAVALHLHRPPHSATEHKSQRQLLQACFTTADSDADGRLDFSEFCGAAAEIGLGVSEVALRTAFARFDLTGDGFISFSEFIDFVCPVITSGVVQKKRSARLHAQREVAVQQFERIIAEAEPSEKLSAETSGILGSIQKISAHVFASEINLRQCFKRWDSDGSGSLNREEFTGMLNDLGFSVDLESAGALFGAFDLDADGKIRCWELVRTLGSLGDAAAPSSAGKGAEAVHGAEADARAGASSGAEADARAEALRREAERAARRWEEEEAHRMAMRELRLREEALSRMEVAAAARAAKSLDEKGRADANSAPSSDDTVGNCGADSDGETAPAPEVERPVPVSALLTTHPTADTELRDMSSYAWKFGPLPEGCSDEEILRALRKRLRYVRVTPAGALAQCTLQPRIAYVTLEELRASEEFATKEVGSAIFVCFCAQLLYEVLPERACAFLSNQNGGGAPALTTAKFLELLTSQAESSESATAKASPQQRARPPLCNVESLTGRERRILTQLREALFERTDEMKAMFQSVDLDSDGFVSVEEFLRALSGAGVAIAHEIDRAKEVGVNEEEAARIVAFFDRDHDGFLSLSEFVRFLQDSKYQLLSTMPPPSESAELRLVRPTTELGGEPIFLGERTAVPGARSIPEFAKGSP